CTLQPLVFLVEEAPQAVGAVADANAVRAIPLAGHGHEVAAEAFHLVDELPSVGEELAARQRAADGALRHLAQAALDLGEIEPAHGFLPCAARMIVSYAVSPTRPAARSRCLNIVDKSSPLGPRNCAGAGQPPSLWTIQGLRMPPSAWPRMISVSASQ